MKKLFFVLPLLLAGCQSERVAFHFQPVAPAVGLAPTGAAPRSPAEIVPVATAPDEAATALTFRVGHRPARRLAARQLLRPAAPVAAPALATTEATAPATPPRLAPRLLRRLGRQHATAGLARTTESGLGGIGLFAIVVVLGILAGLGALVSLIPGVSFFGGVGLAAAGLLVLFILYSLVSGGGKKKPAK